MNNFFSQIKTFLTFAFVGILTALIYFSSFAFLWNLLHINYLISTAIAYFFAMITNFSGNRILTFKSCEGNITAQMYKFVIMVGINFSITLIIVHGIVDGMHQSPYLGLFSAMLTTILTGYYLSRNWVYYLKINQS